MSLGERAGVRAGEIVPAFILLHISFPY
jgi:hypothetical protein